MKELKIRFGIEVEFWNYKEGVLFDPYIFRLYRGWLHTREYYTGMQEIMSKPLLLTKRNFRKTVGKIFKILRKISYKNECVIPFQTVLQRKYKGYIGNGVHIHISIYNKEGENIIENIEENKVKDGWHFLYNQIEKYNMLSPRKILSHHIFGYLRTSEYSFKYKNKFVPIYLSPSRNRKPTTLEFRVFDLEDLLRWKIIRKIILNTVEHILLNSDYAKENIIIKEGSGEDIERIIDDYYNRDVNDEDLDYNLLLEKAADVYKSRYNERRVILDCGRVVIEHRPFKKIKLLEVY